MALSNLFTILKGGAGSGNWGHSGRVGKRGGSGRSRSMLSELAITPTLKALFTGTKQYEGDSYPLVTEIFKELNYTAKPSIVENLDTHIADGDTELYRGVVGSSPEETSTFVKDFKQGSLFIGRGIYGSGTYTAVGKEGVTVAEAYSGNAGDRGIIRMSLSKDAKVITDTELWGMSSKLNELYHESNKKADKMVRAAHRAYSEGNEVKAEILVQKSGQLRIQGNDLYRAMNADSAIAAAAMGYDAMQVSGYMVVMNRGKVKVEL